MGFFGSILSNIQNFTDEPKEETHAALRKKHGFANFDADMERLRTYDPAAEQIQASQDMQEKSATPANTRPRRGQK